MSDRTKNEVNDSYLDQVATSKVVTSITEEQIIPWARGHLPEASAQAFVHWVCLCIHDWENEEVTLRDLLIRAWREWVGFGFPPPAQAEPEGVTLRLVT